MWAIGLVLHVRMMADAGCTPSVYVEAFPTRKPVLADLLGSPRDKLESFAVTFVTIVFDSSVLQERLLVELEQVATEAF